MVNEREKMHKSVTYLDWQPYLIAESTLRGMLPGCPGTFRKRPNRDVASEGLNDECT